MRGPSPRILWRHAHPGAKDADEKVWIIVPQLK